MKIAVDFDDVCVDVEDYKLHFFLQKFPELNVEIATKKTLVETGLLTLEQYETTKDELYGDMDSSLDKLKFKSDCVNTINQLINDGHYVEIVTARSNHSAEIAIELLKRENLDITLTGVGYGNSKSKTLENFNVFIDDTIGHLLEVLNTELKLFIMTNKENKDFINEKVIRVNNWKEFYSQILALA